MELISTYNGQADTSRLAYASLPEQTCLGMRDRIIKQIKGLGDATCSELEKQLNLTHQTCSARLTELSKSNCIVDTGKRRYTPRKRLERVYSLSQELLNRITEK